MRAKNGPCDGQNLPYSPKQFCVIGFWDKGDVRRLAIYEQVDKAWEFRSEASDSSSTHDTKTEAR